MSESHERILVVDDEKHVLVLFSRILQKEGYEVECASSGSEAIEKLAKSSFDLVVTDLKMNGVDGLDLIRKGKTVNRALPFILISGYGTAQTAGTAAREGADVYLMKPIDIIDLKLAVKRLFKNRVFIRACRRNFKVYGRDLNRQSRRGVAHSNLAIVLRFGDRRAYDLSRDNRYRTPFHTPCREIFDPRVRFLRPSLP